MTLEGPVVSATINRLADEVVMLAAQGIVVGLSVTIESPIINLLATSTALSRDRASYLLLRKFTIHWMILLTGVTVLLAFTPLFDLVVVRLMSVPQEVAVWVKSGLRIMTFWSAAIAWRRFLQGIMIRYGQTRKVAWGTLVRLLSSGGTVVFLAFLSNWPGVIIGATALMIGVVAEALYATVAVRPILQKELAPGTPPAEGLALTYRELTRFHLPLAGTSFLILLVQPLVAFGLARSPRPTISLAAWPLIFQFMLLARAGAFALPEVVIALNENKLTFRPIRRFSLTLMVANTFVVVLIVLTPLIDVYLFIIQDASPAVGLLARSGLVMFIPLPALAVLISWLRGLLINKRNTRSITAGMVANLLVTAVVLFVGIQQQRSGIIVAAIALVVAAMVELLYLWWRAGDVFELRLSILDLRNRVAPG